MKIVDCGLRINAWLYQSITVFFFLSSIAISEEPRTESWFRNVLLVIMAGDISAFIT